MRSWIAVVLLAACGKDCPPIPGDPAATKSKTTTIAPAETADTDAPVATVACQPALPPPRNAVDPHERRTGPESSMAAIVGVPVVTGGSLDPEVVRRIVARVSPLDGCQGDPPKRLHLAIDATGQVTSTGPSCAEKRLAVLEFPPGPATIDLPVLPAAERLALPVRVIPAVTQWTPYATTNVDFAEANEISSQYRDAWRNMTGAFTTCLGDNDAPVLAMIRINASRSITIRSGGSGDPKVDACIAKLFEGIPLVKPPLHDVEIACRVARPNSHEPYRIDPAAGYARIDPEAIADAPKDKVALVVLDDRATYATIERALDRAGTTAPYAMLAAKDDTGLVLVGVLPPGGFAAMLPPIESFDDPSSRIYRVIDSTLHICDGELDPRIPAIPLARVGILAVPPCMALDHQSCTDANLLYPSPAMTGGELRTLERASHEPFVIARGPVGCKPRGLVTSH